MNRDMILKTDILDIIFEKRNKDYGAYMLRKFYPGRLRLALVFMLFIAFAFSAFTFLPQKKKGLTGRIYSFNDQQFQKVQITPFVAVKKPAIKKNIVKPAGSFSQKKYSSNILVVADNIKTDSIKDLLPEDVISLVNVTGPLTSTNAVQVINAGSGGDENIKPENKIDRSAPLEMNAADVAPGFPGGMDALKRFLEKNLENPYDQENGETVKVKVKFVVSYTGKLRSFEVVEDGGDIYNKEVIRVIKKMPDWNPGKARGENVSVYYTIPVKFVMSD